MTRDMDNHDMRDAVHGHGHLDVFANEVLFSHTPRVGFQADLVV